MYEYHLVFVTLPYLFIEGLSIACVPPWRQAVILFIQPSAEIFG
ncbi:hypothetical protein B4144_0965 [Bacillus atrophaeus]|nr:hypothetical protein B4144_0965 [Bacillus atrophaeus]